LRFQILQTPYTFGQDIRDDSYYVGVIRHALPRNLAVCFPDIFDEVKQSFETNLALNGSGIGSLFSNTMQSPMVTPFYRMESIQCHAFNPVRCLSHNQQNSCRPSIVYMATFSTTPLGAQERHFAGGNPEYLEININFTKDVMVTAYILRPLPRFLRP